MRLWEESNGKLIIINRKIRSDTQHNRSFIVTTGHPARGSPAAYGNKSFILQSVRAKNVSEYVSKYKNMYPNIKNVNFC